jgi:hypothetical protein
VYWVRRALVLAVALGLVLLLARLIGSDGGSRETAAATTPSVTPSAGGTLSAPPSSTASSGPRHSTDPSSKSTSNSTSKPSTERTSSNHPAEGRQCSASNVRLVLSPAHRVVRSGAVLNVGLTLSAAQGSCTAALDPSRLGVTIMSGKDRIWTSTHCPKAIPRATLVLAAGKESSSTVSWDGRRSLPDCKPGGAVAKPGTYVIQATYAGRLTTPQAFRVT